MENLQLPSAFQIGEIVDVDFNESGKIKNVKIQSIRFTGHKVLYTVLVQLQKNEDGSFRGDVMIEDVDSFCITRDPA